MNVIKNNNQHQPDRRRGDLHESYCPARWIRLKLGSFERQSLKREARRFLEKSTCPHPLRALKSIRATPCFLMDKYATNLDMSGENSLLTWMNLFFSFFKCTFLSFKNSTPLQLTSEQWSSFRLWELKKKKLRCLVNTIAQFTNAWSIHRGFYNEKRWMRIKKS